MKEEEEDAESPQPSTVCQGNAGQLPAEASSGLAGRCLTNQYLKLRTKMTEILNMHVI